MVNQKAKLRSSFLLKRLQIPKHRQQEAQDRFLEFFCEEEGVVGSFASFRNEINTFKLNHLLANSKRLALPKIEGNKLNYYLVRSLKDDLELNRWGLYEPIPKKSLMIPLEAISLLFVPGIAFDKNHFRLGYGKGFYDRLLQHKPCQLKTFGISYRECLFEAALPICEHDRPVETLALF